MKTEGRWWCKMAWQCWFVVMDVAYGNASDTNILQNLRFQEGNRAELGVD